MDDKTRPSAMPWRRPWPLFDVAENASTFGAALSLAAEVDLGDELDRATRHPEVSRLNNREITSRMERDHELALSSRRWAENDDGMLMQTDTRFVPGDVVAIRSAAARDIAFAAAPEQSPSSAASPNRPEAIRRAGVLTRLVYASRPYWLPQSSAWGVMAIKPLTADDRRELWLHGPSLILFSSGMEITKHYVGVDLRLVDRLNYVHDIPPDAADVSPDPLDHPPLTVRSGTTGILRYYSDLENGADSDPLLFRYQLMGLVLLPDSTGRPTNAVIWILRRIDPNLGVTSRHIATGAGLSTVQSSGTFSFVEGLLSNALLNPVAEALAAVMSWGDWNPPDEFGESIPQGRALKKLARRSRFKKAESQGAIAGVHVLSSRSPSVRYSQSTSTGRTLSTHYRVGHWQRYRVGPRDAWHHERRQIPGMIINPGIDEIADIVRVYRLPPPPTAKDPERHA